MGCYNIIWYGEPDEFWENTAKHIEDTDVVLDVGCGIVPMNFFRPRLHIMLEPFDEYLDILSYRHAGDKSVLLLQGSAQEMLPRFGADAVDTVFLLDVIEHVPKEDGYALLRQSERIARKQVVVFTPLGFMPQHMESGDTDAWGLNGAKFQEHLSGWLPEDFGQDWSFHICETFHKYDFRLQPIEEPYGAMFAIRTFAEKKSVSPPGKLVDIRKPLPSEIALTQEQLAHNQTQAILQTERSAHAETQNKLLESETLFTTTQKELAATRHTLEAMQSELADVRQVFEITQGELADAEDTLRTVQNELSETQGALAAAQKKLSEARHILQYPLVRYSIKVWRSIGFWK